MISRFKRLLARFRTYQLRHFGSWGGLRIGTPVWCLQPPPYYFPGYRLAAEVEFLPTTHTPGTVGVRIFHDSPLGNRVVTSYVPLSKIEYRSPED
jgi:hypothetical protein